MSETREDDTVMGVLGEYNLPYYCEPHGLTKLAKEVVRLRDEARGVRAVERWVSHDDTMNLRITAHDERFMAQCEGIVHASAPTLAALGLELLRQGRVTL